MKYVGFDCDECLAQVDQFMPFTVTDAAPSVFDSFANKIASFPFIRPTFWPLLERILEEKEKGTVRTFIYSNNSSYPTLKFVGSLVDKRLGTEGFFDTIAHYGNSLRTDNTNRQYVKKWDSMKKFIDKTFETDVRPQDVMFFDDLPHTPLNSQLGSSNYIQVTPYERLSSRVDNNELLKSWAQSEGDPRFIDVEPVEEIGSLPPDEEREFLQKFEIFLRRMTGGQGKKRKRKTRRKYRYKA